MSAAHIDDVLALTGRLDDSSIEDPARERFRAYLLENVTDAALLRDYIDQCRSRPDEQHGRAMRDLINHYGRLLGFDVTFGPYEWLPGQVGFDGRWTSPWGLHIVVEVKSRESFAAQRPSLARSVERLIADGVIPNWTLALGLYVVAHPDLQVNHLEKAILDEKQTHQIRLITPESLYTLTVLQRSGQLSQQDVLTLLRSSSPAADWLVELVSRLSNGTAWATKAGEAIAGSQPAVPPPPAAAPDSADVAGATEVAGTQSTAAGRPDDEAEAAEVEPEPAQVEPELAEVEPEPAQVETEPTDVEPELAGTEPESVEAGPEGSRADAEGETLESEAEAARAEDERAEAEAEEPAAGTEAPKDAPEAAPAVTRSPPPPPLDFAEVLECFGNCVVRTLEFLLQKRLQ